MGLPALRQEPRVTLHRPHLRVVSPGSKAPKGAARPAVRPRTNSSAYQSFVFFAVVVVVLAGLGVGRVWLSVQAAQASIDCGKLQSAIKTARYEGDMLEIQKSALSTPSRVQAIAVRQLGMAPAVSMSYLRIDSAKRSTVVAKSDASPQRGTRSDVLDQLMGIAAAQARMLLVGDVGLSSSR
jgi:cell division protein FtsL